MRRPLALTVFAATALLSLAACSTGSSDGNATAPTPTPVASDPATSAPEPTPSVTPATLPATIVIGAEATDIVTADGTVLASLNYQSDGDTAVTVLRSLLGEPTAESVADKTLHDLAADITEWGGFAIAVNRPDADSALRPGPYSSAFLVRAIGTTATNGVAVKDVNGVQAGHDFEATAAGKPADQVQYDENFGINSVTLDMPSSFPGVVPDYGMPMTYGVIGFTGPQTGTIDTILAPTYLYSVV
jgi:hypothetical protein